MKQVVKKSHEAKTVFLCVDLSFLGNESVIKKDETRDVKLKYVNDDLFEAVEKMKTTGVYKDRHRTTLARTIHGRMSVDEYGVYVGFYFRHDEFIANPWLAEVLDSEAEQMGDIIVELDPISRSAICK